MKKKKEEGNLKKDEDNNHISSPFKKPEEVIKFNQKTPETKDKNKRLYRDVSYAKNLCLSLKYTASVFHLNEIIGIFHLRNMLIIFANTLVMLEARLS